MFILRKFTSQILLRKITKCSYSTITALKEERIKLDKWDINYMKVGKGPHHVLLVPGALGTMWTDFKPQIEGFDREKFTLVAWDPPGYGKTRPPNKEFPADFYERDAEYAYEFMKALKIPKYSVIGWSDGGCSALIHAAKYPDAMIKLVGIATNSFILPKELELYDKVKDVSNWSEKMKAPMVAAYGDFFQNYWHLWIEGVERVYKANDGNICTQLLKDIDCPTLIFYGEKDPMVDPVHASHLHTNIRNSRLHLYPDGKHNIHIKYANDFNKRTQEFLLQP